MGYSGGAKEDPTYHNLGNHTETLQIDFDPEKLGYNKILDIFWKSHEPTGVAWSTQYKNILFYHNEKQILNILLEKLNSIAQRSAIYTEFRNLHDLNSLIEQFESKGYIYQDHLNYIVNTEPEKSAGLAISKSKKRQINKSLKAGAQIISPENINQVKEFYDILKNLYKTKIKKPLPEWTFPSHIDY